MFVRIFYHIIEAEYLELFQYCHPTSLQKLHFFKIVPIQLEVQLVLRPNLQQIIFDFLEQLKLLKNNSIL